MSWLQQVLGNLLSRNGSTASFAQNSTPPNAIQTVTRTLLVGQFCTRHPFLLSQLRDRQEERQSVQCTVLTSPSPCFANSGFPGPVQAGNRHSSKTETNWFCNLFLTQTPRSLRFSCEATPLEWSHPLGKLLSLVFCETERPLGCPAIIDSEMATVAPYW